MGSNFVSPYAGGSSFAFDVQPGLLRLPGLAASGRPAAAETCRKPAKKYLAAMADMSSVAAITADPAADVAETADAASGAAVEIAASVAAVEIAALGAAVGIVAVLAADNFAVDVAVGVGTVAIAGNSAGAAGIGPSGFVGSAGTCHAAANHPGAPVTADRLEVSAPRKSHCRHPACSYWKLVHDQGPAIKVSSSTCVSVI